MIVTTDCMKSCITKNIFKIFDGVSIYKDDVSQGLKAPCFFIRLLESEQEKRGPFYERYYTFILRYHAKDKASSSELERIQDVIYEHMLILHDADFVLRCNKPRCQIQDGVLHVTLEYKLKLLKQEEANPMQSIDEIKGGLK